MCDHLLLHCNAYNEGTSHKFRSTLSRTPERGGGIRNRCGYYISKVTRTREGSTVLRERETWRIYIFLKSSQRRSLLSFFPIWVQGKECFPIRIIFFSSEGILDWDWGASFKAGISLAKPYWFVGMYICLNVYVCMLAQYAVGTYLQLICLGPLKRKKMQDRIF